MAWIPCRNVQRNGAKYEADRQLQREHVQAAEEQQEIHRYLDVRERRRA